MLLPHTFRLTLSALHREEGAAGLYRGFVPKAIRLGLGQTIGLMTFKQTLLLLGANEEPPEVVAAAAAAAGN